MDERVMKVPLLEYSNFTCLYLYIHTYVESNENNPLFYNTSKSSDCVFKHYTCTLRRVVKMRLHKFNRPVEIVITKSRSHRKWPKMANIKFFISTLNLPGGSLVSRNEPAGKSPCPFILPPPPLLLFRRFPSPLHHLSLSPFVS